MRVSALLCASVAVFTVSSFGGGAFGAVPGASADRGPSFFRLTANDPAAEQACKDKGGAVSTDQDGYKMCTIARACAAPGGATRTTKLDANDPAAAKKCKDACGVVSTDKDGAQVCTKSDGS
ncbi:MAG: hypothetical protein K8S25_01520 [Alphaproteobacteria bacterium]|nr:hypothetical protein [Alphaproteobacteria bacterium]